MVKQRSAGAGPWRAVPRTCDVAETPVISIIDDDESVRMATERFVKAFGFIGHSFGCAEAFLASPQLNTSSCVIADVQMPGMSGVDLQRRLIAGGNRTPIILVTAFPDDKVRAKALAAGAIGFLTKPCDCATLIRCVETALRQHRDASRC
jgi:FixJ family two-component response regulator